MDYYAIVGVAKTATTDEIEKAYRTLAKKYHPDRNIGVPEAENKFKELQNAYDTIVNPLKRAEYDRRNLFTNQPHTNIYRPKPKTKTKEDFEREKAEQKEKERRFREPTQQDLDNINCTFFGGPSTGTGRNILVSLKLTPEEMKTGCYKVLTIKKRDWCRRCVGDGNHGSQCPKCRDDRHTVGHCITCGGLGTIWSKCAICNGEGVKPWILAALKVNVSPNVQAGHTINILGEGETAPHKPPGNVRVVIVP